MELQHIQQKLAQAKEDAQQRKFVQSVDFIINLKNLNFKKPDDHVDFYVQLPYTNGKKLLICALVGPELEEEARKVCDRVLTQEEFSALSKKELKNVASTYHYFIAQANIMAAVAKTFGRILGPRGKMPDPKAGCVVPPKTNLQPLYDRLQQTIRVVAKKDPVVHLLVGTADQDEKEVSENMHRVYTQLRTNLPLEENNIKNALVKLTMGKPVVL